MKRFLLATYALFATSILLAQTYQYAPFPQQHGVWHFTQYSDNWTVIGGTNLVFQLDTASGLMTGAGAYFEKDKRIYVIDGGDTTLMYDFNLTLGDTIIADATFGTDTFYVAIDDSAGYHGRRSITLEATSSLHYMPTVWVEGIGNISGFGTLWENFSGVSISGGYRFWCMYGDSVSIPCNSSLSVKDNPIEQSSFSVFPNPAKNRITIQNITSAFDELILFNTMGQKVIVKQLPGNSEMELNLRALKPGVYSLMLIGKNKTRAVKIIKK